MDRRIIMTALAVTLALSGCNEATLPAPDVSAAPPAELTPAPPAAESQPPAAAPAWNARATIGGMNLTSALFGAKPPDRRFAEARALVSRAWGQDCKPGSVSEVIAGGTDRSAWRVDCAGGEISTSSGGQSPDYLIEIPNEPEQAVIVNQCARRDGVLACDTAGRDRS